MASTTRRPDGNRLTVRCQEEICQSPERVLIRCQFGNRKSPIRWHIVISWMTNRHRSVVLVVTRLSLDRYLTLSTQSRLPTLLRVQYQRQVGQNRNGRGKEAWGQGRGRESSKIAPRAFNARPLSGAVTGDCHSSPCLGAVELAPACDGYRRSRPKL